MFDGVFFCLVTNISTPAMDFNTNGHTCFPPLGKPSFHAPSPTPIRRPCLGLVRRLVRCTNQLWYLLGCATQLPHVASPPMSMASGTPGRGWPQMCIGPSFRSPTPPPLPASQHPRGGPRGPRYVQGGRRCVALLHAVRAAVVPCGPPPHESQCCPSRRRALLSGPRAAPHQPNLGRIRLRAAQ